MKKVSKQAETLDSVDGKIDQAEAHSTQTETPATPLSGEEKALLKTHEVTIKAGLQTFHDVGMAFAEIRDRGLYREHGTFDDYCREVWKVSRSKAYRYMKGAKCVDNLKCRHGATNEPLAIPKTEKQARKLATLKPEAQVEVAKAVAKKTCEPTTKDFDTEIEALEEPRVKAYDIRTEAAKPTPLKLDTDLVPMSKIAETIKAIYYIYENPNKRQEGLNMFGKLQRWVAAWEQWEAKHGRVV